MADADAQPPVLLRRQVRGDVLQPVVAAAAAAELQLHGAGRQIELVVRDEDLIWQDLEETRDRDDRLAGTVHVGLRLEQMHFLAVQARAWQSRESGAPRAASCRPRGRAGRSARSRRCGAVAVYSARDCRGRRSV
jgi:hypothetical protein